MNTNLSQLLQQQALAHPAKTAIVFLADGEGEAQRINYRDMDARARALAARLQARGLAGEPLLLLLPSGIDFVVAFLASLYAGAVPVPLFPPGSSAHAQRVARVAADCGARGVWTNSNLARQLRERMAGAFADEAWLMVDEPADPHQEWVPPVRSRSDLAFLQYTSGSTGDPRGVMVTHGNLLHHGEQLRTAWQLTPDDVFVSWLPLSHDMGLIGSVLQPLLTGASVVLMPPATFLQRPMRWLEAVSRFRGTVSFAPDFAYSLCASRTGAVPDAALDLASWRIACNAAEPVRADSLRRFAARFGPCGFRPEALAPSYGLAEATLLVTPVSHASAEPSVVRVDADALERGRFAPLCDPLGRGLDAVGCGRPVEAGTVAIVDAGTSRRLADGEIGEVWVRGALVAAGYWRRPEETVRTFQATLPDDEAMYLRTGDLGALHEGQLYVMGRLKDLIIVRGQNHHPSDIEHTAQCAHDALGRAAAFAIDEEGQERVVLVAELRREARHSFDGEEILARLTAELAGQHGLQLHALVLVKPTAVPVTSSGKVRRRTCRKLFVDAGFDPLFQWRGVPVHAIAALPPQVTVSRPAALGRMPPQEAAPAITDLLFRHSARVLQLDEERQAQLRADFPGMQLVMMGLDSLAAIELSNHLKTELGVEMPVSELLAGATVAQVVRQLHGLLIVQQLCWTADVATADEGTEVWTV